MGGCPVRGVMYLNSCHHVYSQTVASGTFVLLYAAGLTCEWSVSRSGGSHVPKINASLVSH